MRGLVFAQSVNKVGRHDANGAFVPGARLFTHAHGLGQPVWLDDRQDRATMIGAIEAAQNLDTVVYFGHGTQASIPSADIYWKNLPALASAIRGAAAPGCQVVLYACSTGAVGCFANQLSKLMDYRFTVWGHTCVGHSFTNPYVTRFPYPGASPYLVDPHGPVWREWVKLIKSNSDIWARYPFMEASQFSFEVVLS